jgi:hypothetical protein
LEHHSLPVQYYNILQLHTAFITYGASSISHRTSLFSNRKSAISLRTTIVRNTTALFNYETAFFRHRIASIDQRNISISSTTDTYDYADILHIHTQHILAVKKHSSASEEHPLA